MTTQSTKFLALGCLSLAIACGGSETSVDQPMPTKDTAQATDVKAIPDGFTAITPVLVVNDIDQALAFYAEALGATTKLTLPGPDGKTMHAEMQLGESVIMLNPEDTARNVKSPTSLGGTNGSLLVYVEDVDAALKTAVDAGATMNMPAGDMFWGDRFAGVVDPFGHMWGLATHKEDVSEAEMNKRAGDWAQAAAAQKPYTPPAVTTPAASYKPEGYATVTVTLLVSSPEQVAFYSKALGAKVSEKMLMPGGRLMHATAKLGGAIFHLTGEFPEMSPTHKSATNLGGAPVSVYHYVKDADAAFKAAVDGGATASAPVGDMFWGDRWGVVKDPAGNDWGIATHKQDMTKEQMMMKMKEQLSGAAQ